MVAFCALLFTGCVVEHLFLSLYVVGGLCVDTGVCCDVVSHTF